MWYGQIWDQEVGQQTVQVVMDYAVKGPEEVALAVEANPFLRKWYEVPEACPHITVLINEGYESKHMGPMTKRASEAECRPTVKPLMWVSLDGSMTKILFGTTALGQTKHIQIIMNETKIMGQLENKVDGLQDEMIA